MRLVPPAFLSGTIVITSGRSLQNKKKNTFENNLKSVVLPEDQLHPRFLKPAVDHTTFSAFFFWTANLALTLSTSLKEPTPTGLLRC